MAKGKRFARVEEEQLQEESDEHNHPPAEDSQNTNEIEQEDQRTRLSFRETLRETFSSNYALLTPVSAIEIDALASRSQIQAIH
jgi:hypothetical protein